MKGNYNNLLPFLIFSYLFLFLFFRYRSPRKDKNLFTHPIDDILSIFLIFVQSVYGILPFIEASPAKNKLPPNETSDPT